MSRLIDADKLKDNIIKCLKPLEPKEEMIDVNVASLSVLMEIDRQPKAFDVEKVVKRLKDLKVMYWFSMANTGDEKLDFAYENVGNALDRAIEIVKGGGAE